MAASFFDNWDFKADRWIVVGRAVSTAGTVTLDANAEGPVSMQPWFYSDTLFNSICVFQHDVTLNGRLMVGPSTSSTLFSPNVASIDLDYDGARTTFSANPSTISGFDGSQFLQSNSFVLRAAYDVNTQTLRFVISKNGTNVADTGWLDADWLYQSSVPVTDMALGALIPITSYRLVSGTASFGSTTGFYGVSLNEADTFMTSGVLPVDKVPDISISTSDTPHGTEVTLSVSDSTATIFYTLNDQANPEGPFGSKNNNVYKGTFVVNSVSHLRAGASAPGKIESNLLDTWLRLADGAVVPPEITPPSMVLDIEMPIEVKISHVNNAASIRYTVDGSDPTSSSPLYSGSFMVRSSTTVKATAFIGPGQSEIVETRYNEYPTVTTVDVTSLAFWKYSGNASVVAGGIQVDDNAGNGVYPIIQPQLPAVTFRVTGKFQLKLPGTSVYFMWANAGVGIGSDSYHDALQTFSNANTYADVRVYAYKRPSSTAVFVYYQVTGDVDLVKITGYDVVDRFDLAFSGKGEAPFTVSNLQYVENYQIPASADPFYYADILSSPFFNASYPLQVSNTPTMLPAGPDISASDVTLSGGAGATFVSKYGDGSYNDPITTGTTIPGFYNENSYPLIVWSRATEPGKLESKLARRVFYSKRTPNWFSDLPMLLDNWNVRRSYSNWTTNTYETLVGRDSRELCYGPYGGPWSAPFNPFFLDDGRFERSWDSFELTWADATFDTDQNLWMQFVLNPSRIYDFRIMPGFDVPDSVAAPTFQLVHKFGVTANRASMMGFNVDPVKVGTAHATDWVFEKQPQSFSLGSYLSPLAQMPLKIGRRGTRANGAIRIQLVDVYAGGNLYDSGWINVVSADPVRPRILVQTRRGHGTGGQMTMGISALDGYYGITDAQLDNLFDSGSIDGLAPPTFGSITPGNNTGNVHVDLSISDPTSMVNVNYDGFNAVVSPLYMFFPSQQQVLPGSSTATNDIINPASVSAALSKPFHGSLSAAPNPFIVLSRQTRLEVTRATNEFLTIRAVRKGEIEIYGDGTTFQNQPYWIVFDDGSRFQYTWGFRAIQKTLGPGSHWVKLISGNYNMPTGETSPMTFSVPSDGSLITSTPSTVGMGSPGSFNASATGGTGSWRFKWEFSDGFESTSSSVLRTIAKPGRYSFKVTAEDGAENVLVETGNFVVPYVASIAQTMSRTTETRIS